MSQSVCPSVHLSVCPYVRLFVQINYNFMKERFSLYNWIYRCFLVFFQYFVYFALVRTKGAGCVRSNIGSNKSRVTTERTRTTWRTRKTGRTRRTQITGRTRRTRKTWRTTRRWNLKGIPFRLKIILRKFFIYIFSNCLSSITSFTSFTSYTSFTSFTSFTSSHKGRRRRGSWNDNECHIWGGGAKCVKSVKCYLNGPLSRMLSKTCNGWL